MMPGRPKVDTTRPNETNLHKCSPCKDMVPACTKHSQFSEKTSSTAAGGRRNISSTQPMRICQVLNRKLSALPTTQRSWIRHEASAKPLDCSSDAVQLGCMRMAARTFMHETPWRNSCFECDWIAFDTNRQSYGRTST